MADHPDLKGAADLLVLCRQWSDERAWVDFGELVVRYLRTAMEREINGSTSRSPADEVLAPGSSSTRLTWDHFASLFRDAGYANIPAALTKWGFPVSADLFDAWDADEDIRQTRYQQARDYLSKPKPSGTVSDCPRCGKPGAPRTGSKGPFWKCNPCDLMWDAHNRDKKRTA